MGRGVLTKNADTKDGSRSRRIQDFLLLVLNTTLGMTMEGKMLIIYGGDVFS